jgi:hypothetical protein
MLLSSFIFGGCAQYFVTTTSYIGMLTQFPTLINTKFTKTFKKRIINIAYYPSQSKTAAPPWQITLDFLKKSSEIYRRKPSCRDIMQLHFHERGSFYAQPTP